MPSECGFEPRSPRYGPFLVLGLFDTNGAQSGSFLAIFEPFFGRIVELKGKKGLLVTGQSRRTWSVATVSLRLSVLTGLENNILFVCFISFFYLRVTLQSALWLPG